MIGIFRGGMYPDVTVTTKYSSGSIQLKRGPRPHTPLFQVKREFCEIRVTLNICDFLGGGGSNFSLSLPKNSSFLLESACAHFVQSAGQHCTWPKREENVSRKSYDLQVNVNRCCVSSTTRDLAGRWTNGWHLLIYEQTIPEGSVMTLVSQLSIT